MATYLAQDIARKVDGQLMGQSDLAITGVEDLDQAGPGHITFIRDAQHAPRWDASKASAALIGPDVQLQPAPGKALIRVADADLALAVVLELFAPALPRPAVGVHPSAIVDPSAILGRNVAIGAHCFVGARVRLGDDVVLHPNVTILDDSTLGHGTHLWPGVVVRERCQIGDRCILHPNVVIGSDGFGYRPAPGGKGLIKIPQIGTVVLGHEVEIGSGTTIDRGKFAATSIGDGTKVDNLCQIAHNVRIGRCCVLAGQVGIAGSTTLGDGVMMGGKAGLRDHIHIGDGAQIAASAAVMKDVPPGETWAGMPAQEARAALRETATIRKLPELVKQVRAAMRGGGAGQ